jgi:hypothetical protein
VEIFFAQVCYLSLLGFFTNEDLPFSTLNYIQDQGLIAVDTMADVAVSQFGHSGVSTPHSID